MTEGDSGFRRMVRASLAAFARRGSAICTPRACPSMTTLPRVIPAQAGIQAGDAAVARGWRALPDGRVRLSCPWSCPLCGQGLSKPLDSGLRRNDGGGFRLSPDGTVVPGCFCQTRLCHLNPAGVSINDDITLRHSSASWNPGGGWRGGVGMAGFAGCPRSVTVPVAMPAVRAGLV